jgi:hypothetical protein
MKLQMFRPVLVEHSILKLAPFRVPRSQSAFRVKQESLTSPYVTAGALPLFADINITVRSERSS